MLQDKSILIYERNPAASLELAMAVAIAGGNIVGPANTARHVRVLARKTRLDGILFDLDRSDEEALPTVDALIGVGVPLVVYTDDEPPPQLKDSQVPVYRRVPARGARRGSRQADTGRLIYAFHEEGIIRMATLVADRSAATGSPTAGQQTGTPRCQRIPMRSIVPGQPPASRSGA